MNTEQQIRSAVANIQDELLRIIACADVQPVEQNHVTEAFKAKVIGEFNTKLRGFKSKIRVLKEENERLRQRVDFLERQSSAHGGVARPTKSLGSIPCMAAPLSNYRAEERIEIMSSPEKENGVNSGGADLTSSQLNKLPTQYSEEDQGGIVPEQDESTNTKAEVSPSRKSRSPRKRPKLTSSPIKAMFVEEDDRIVADSQDEFEPLGPDRPGHPSHYTALQRIEFLRNYYRMKLSEGKYRVDLSSNPITEKPWVLADFKPNGNWRRPKHLHSHVGVMTKAQEQIYQQFFQEAGHGIVVSGPKWDEQTEGEEGEEEIKKDNQGKEKEKGNGWISNEHPGNKKVNGDGGWLGGAREEDEFNNEHDFAKDNCAEDNSGANNFRAKSTVRSRPHSGPGRNQDKVAPSHEWVASQVMDKYLSPPGFMTGLFPSTQQAQANRAAVAEKNQERIARRVASALSQQEFVFYEEVLNTYVAQGRYI